VNTAVAHALAAGLTAGDTDVVHTAGLEAEAYAAWLRGSALLEKEADWQAALAALMRAK
jgi:formylglycine-generating enzyme required for sulfatase activity